MVDTWRGKFRDGYVLLEGGRVFCRGRVVLFRGLFRGCFGGEQEERNRGFEKLGE